MAHDPAYHDAFSRPHHGQGGSPYYDYIETPLLGHPMKQASYAVAPATSPAADGPGGGRASPLLRWRPFYLRRVVLTAFIVVFGLAVLAIELLLAFSNQNDGLATADPSKNYLRTYGPTAFLILVSAFWARAEYQSKVVAPWIRLSMGPTEPCRGLLLDYVSAWQVGSLFKSLRNRDFTVSITTCVSLILKILIVLSTGLITLSWIGVKQSTSALELTEGFIDAASAATRVNKTGTLPFFFLCGLSFGFVSFLSGVSKEFVFQSFQSTLPAAAEVKLTVDAFVSSLDCQSVELDTYDAFPPPLHLDGGPMNFTLTSPGSDIDLRTNASPFPIPDNYTGNYTYSITFTRFLNARCTGTTDDDGRRILVVFGNMTYHGDRTQLIMGSAGQWVNATVGKMLRSTQLLCIPKYDITKVDIVRNGTRLVDISLSDHGANRTLASVSPWSIVDAHFASYDNEVIKEEAHQYVYQIGYRVNVSDVQVDVDHSMQTMLGTQITAANTSISSLFEASFLHQVTAGYYNQFAAVIAKQSLLRPLPSPVQARGFATINAYRLVLREWAAQWMAGMLAVCVILAVVALWIVPRSGVLPRAPSSMLASAALFRSSPGLLAGLHNAGAASDKTLERYIQGTGFRSLVDVDSFTGRARFAVGDVRNPIPPFATTAPSSTPANDKLSHPMSLHPVFRVVVCLVLLAYIVTLELLLRKSDSNDGLGDVGDDSYLHYSWTSLPALALGISTVAVSTIDFTSRLVSPLVYATKGVSTESLLNLEFLDMSVPRAIYREAKLGNFGALASTFAFLVASLFTIISGSMFQPTYIPTTASITLVTNQSFPYNATADGITDTFLRGGILSSLVLDGNYSYPSFTYQDLAFPQLLIQKAPDSASGLNTSTVVIQATVPAIRGRLNCRTYDASQIQTNLTIDYSIPYSYDNPLGLYIDGEKECIGPKYAEVEQQKYNMHISTYSNATYFAHSTGAYPASDKLSCSRKLYAFGELDYSARPIIKNVAAMGCNTTLEVVDVDATFVGTDLDLDPQSPPRPRESTARATSANSLVSGDYDVLGNMYGDWTTAPTYPQLLDSFFSLIVSSSRALPMSRLGDPTATADVADAIRWHHGVVLAQILGTQLVPANETDAFITAGAAHGPQLPAGGPSDAEAHFTATLADTPDSSRARRRVGQNTVSTRVLQGLLAAVVVALLFGWFALPRADVLARGPASVASAAALVAGTNVPSLLPVGAEMMSDVELVTALGPRRRVWLGWG